MLLRSVALTCAMCAWIETTDAEGGGRSACRAPHGARGLKRSILSIHGNDLYRCIKGIRKPA